MFAIKYDDGKVFECYDTKKDAERELSEIINNMNGDNWCGLHIEKVSHNTMI